MMRIGWPRDGNPWASGGVALASGRGSEYHTSVAVDPSRPRSVMILPEIRTDDRFPTDRDARRVL